MGKMKNRLFAPTFILLLVLSISLIVSGCAKSAKYDTAEPNKGQSGSYLEEKTQDGDYASGITSGGTSQSYSYGSILAGRKIIFKANVTVEVENMNETIGKIETIISGSGFISSSRISKDKIKRGGQEIYLSSGVVVVRIAQEKFDSVLKSISGLGNVIDSQSYSDEVTDQYFDTESRLKILRIEESRLLDYLETISDPDTIFKYEQRLSEVRTQIEGLTGTLRKLDDLVDFSTITLNIREVLPEQLDENPDGSFFERLWNGFVKSLKSTVRFLGEFLIVIAKALPAIAVLAVIGLIVLLIMGWPRKFKIFGKNKRNV